MNFRQLDNEHDAQAWEHMKTLVKNCPTHGLTTWMVIQTFYAGLKFTSRNLLDSAAGGTFMSTTLGAATKLLDEMMLNYSQWHIEQSPTGVYGGLVILAHPRLMVRECTLIFEPSRD